MEDLWLGYRNNEDILDLVLRILSFILGSSFLGIIGWVVNRWWIKKQRLDLAVFDVVTNPQDLLPLLYGTSGDNDLLADHNILYQQRDAQRNIQEELRKILYRRRYLLIIAPTGYGKTREAGVLAQGLMAEGYRVIRVRSGWLDEPKELPKELNGQRTRILLLLDDLSGLFRSGAHVQSPLFEKIPMIKQMPFRDRLLRSINAFELMCGDNEVRVIATTRSEPSEWEWLRFDDRDELWQRFGQPFELPKPSHDAIIRVLKATSSAINIKAKEDDFSEIAAMNMGAFRNIVQNVRRILSEGEVLSADQYLPTLYGSWRESYEIIIDQYPIAENIYNAIDLLQQVKVQLYLPLVEKLALLLCTGNRLKRIYNQIQIRRTLEYLLYESNVFPSDKNFIIPYDGQIEAKPFRLRWQLFCVGIMHVILNLADKHSAQLAASVINFGTVLVENGQLDFAKTLFEMVDQKISRSRIPH